MISIYIPTNHNILNAMALSKYKNFLNSHSIKSVTIVSIVVVVVVGGGAAMISFVVFVNSLVVAVHMAKVGWIDFLT